MSENNIVQGEVLASTTEPIENPEPINVVTVFSIAQYPNGGLGIFTGQLPPMVAEREATLADIDRMASNVARELNRVLLAQTLTPQDQPEQ